MYNNKMDSILYMYNRLIEGKVVFKNDILDKFQINERTFYRYIKNIKEFIENPSSELIGQSIDFDRLKGGYILNGKAENNLNEKEILAISKVILESRGFVKSEIQSILNKLLENCVSEDKDKIKRIIGNELINYESPKHGKELLDKLWEISNAIKEQNVLQIGYYKMGCDGKLQDEVANRTLYPQGLLFSEYYFYLIAFIEGTSYDYPTIYRVDRIENLIVTNKKYKVDYSERFKDGEFRKLIQFMHTGKLERIKFRYTGWSIEAVLDKLPNAKVVQEKPGEYIVETSMFGKGIKMWLLSQGDSVEVIGSEQFREEMLQTIDKMRNLYV